MNSQKTTQENEKFASVLAELEQEIERTRSLMLQLEEKIKLEPNGLIRMELDELRMFACCDYKDAQDMLKYAVRDYALLEP